MEEKLNRLIQSEAFKPVLMVTLIFAGFAICRLESAATHQNSVAALEKRVRLERLAEKKRKALTADKIKGLDGKITTFQVKGNTVTATLEAKESFTKRLTKKGAYKDTARLMKQCFLYPPQNIMSVTVKVTHDGETLGTIQMVREEARKFDFDKGWEGWK